MRLLNFSTGKTQTQYIDGEEVRTAYIKEPVPEPWVITAHGADGDEVAVHTDHLYAFDRKGYRFWASELGEDPAYWSDGHFAENLTVDTLDQSSLRVGDHYRLGTATVVVTGPRVPCWKLTWRLGQPKTFMRRFRQSGHSGCYFGVIEPGVARPDDEFVLMSGDESAPSVLELSRLCDSSPGITHREREIIDIALAADNLSKTVRSTLSLKIAALDREQSEAPGAWKGWRRFEINGVAHETADAASFRLRPLDSGQLPEYRAGQHIVVRLTPPGEPPIMRTWSLSEFSRSPEQYRITVRLRQSGKGSDALTAGASAVGVELRSPAGQFQLDRGSFRPVVLIASGIGITPMIAMIQAHLERGSSSPPLWLFYGVPDPGRAAFREYLNGLFAHNEDLNLHYFYSRIKPDSMPDESGVNVHCGRITATRIVEVMRGNYLRTPDGPASLPWFESDLYICGSEEFSKTVRNELVQAGANPDLVRTEDFTAASAAAVMARRSTDAIVEYRSRGLEATWKAKEEQTLLELAEDNGVELPYECRVGTCRTCESRLLNGEVDGPTTIGTDDGKRVLLCISYPFSDRIVVEPPEE